MSNVVIGQNLKSKGDLLPPIPFNWYFIGIHNGFGESQDETFKDIVHTCKRRLDGSKIVICGDFNVDELPNTKTGPLQDNIFAGETSQRRKFAV
eukprot:9853033-Karenia_brevis.AAC.1